MSSANLPATTAAAEVPLSPELQEVHDLILAEVKNFNEQMIMTRHRVGSLLLEVARDEGKYGGEGAEVLLLDALRLHVPDGGLGECRQLASTFSEAQLRKLVARPTASGRTLTWTHFNYLSGKLTAEMRKEFLARCYREDLSARDLLAAIQEKLGERRPSTGRPLQAPKTPRAGLLQISRLSADFHKRSKLWEKAVFKPLQEMAANTASPETLKQVEEVLGSVDRLQNEAIEMREILESTRDRLRTLLSSSQKAKPVTRASAARKK